MPRVMTALVLLGLISVTLAVAAPTVVKQRDFDDLAGWQPNPQLFKVKPAGGLLTGEIEGPDSFLTSPQFEIKASPWQAVELRLKTDCGGSADIFWTNTTQSPYAGFMPTKQTGFEIIGDNEWHEYRIQPYWQAEDKIILLRLDFPNSGAGRKTFALDWLRIVDLGGGQPVKTSAWDFRQGPGGWTASGEGTMSPEAAGLAFNATGKGFALNSPPLQVPVDGKWCVYLEADVKAPAVAGLTWASQKQSGLKRLAFPLRPGLHHYNLDLSNSPGWEGDALLLSLSLPSGTVGTLRRLEITDEMRGPADVEALRLTCDTALPRVGQNVPLSLSLRNNGGAPATGLKIAKLDLPAGVRIVSMRDWQSLPEIPAGETIEHRMIVKADGAVSGPMRLTLSGPGAEGQAVEGTLNVTKAIQVPKTGYIPEPVPAKSDYEIGAYYFPGWATGARWAPIERVAPERKPVLGWYDEANPECADWQIKWAVEHGISYFMVDWYWSAGGRHLEHWVHDAYMKSKYRPYLKWCMMWANHNAPNTHSEADQRAVTKYWIDSYFGMKEYYRIDDMPVVIIWAPGNIRRDMGGTAGAKKLLDISQEMVKAAGYKGIYFMAMSQGTVADATLLKSEGYSMTSSYHYMGHGGRAENPMRFPFKLVADTSYDHWEGIRKNDVLPFLPNLSTGWDSRPWHGDNNIVIYDRTVPLFRQICEDAKRFADANGIKRLALGPLNEWGEGSYLEPCQEFGFEMYDVVRDVFCKPGTPHLDYGPADIGRGPYDLKDLDTPLRTSWDFSDGAQGWGPMMGIGGVKVEDGKLLFTTASTDPALGLNFPAAIQASKFSALRMRVKAEGPPGAKEGIQLFWSGNTTWSEASSVRADLALDGQWHDVVLDLKASPRWRGKVRGLRLDTGSRQGVQWAIEDMRLE
ncbi:MAG: glycoside hydrolase family 99-like domain-containing protein [Armatimonadia bacterium]